MTDAEELKRAKQLLDEAADIIEKELHMSGLEQRFGDIPEAIRRISEKDSESVLNLIRETEYLDEEHPVWTRPLVSPKHTNRKDI